LKIPDIKHPRMARTKTSIRPQPKLRVKEIVRREQEKEAKKAAKGAPAKLLQCTAKNARCGKRCRRPVDPRFQKKYNQLCYVHADPAHWREWKLLKASLPSAGEAYASYNEKLRALKEREQKREQTEGEESPFTA